jgi:hypothetical protein
MRQNIGDLEIGIYYGSSNIKLQNTEQWKKEFESHRVLIFTVQIFLNLLTHNLFCKFKKYFSC